MIPPFLIWVIVIAGIGRVLFAALQHLAETSRRERRRW